MQIDGKHRSAYSRSRFILHDKFIRLSGLKFSRRFCSWTLAAILDSCIVLGAALLLCGLAGIGSNSPDTAIFISSGGIMLVVAVLFRFNVTRPVRPIARRVITGVAAIWVVLVAFGAMIYLLTGSVSTIDGALLESAAGFTTTAVTILDPTSVSRSILLWRAATSWIGGLMVVVVSVAVMPDVLRNLDLIGYKSLQRGRGIASNSRAGFHRVLLIYVGFTVLCVLAYLLAGLEFIEAVVVGLGTVSTGGFAPHLDSMAGYDASVLIVATLVMLLTGSGVFVLWWFIRGRMRSLLSSQELRTYLLILAGATAIIASTGEADLGEALFTVVSTFSTTGYAIVDWTVWPAESIVVLMIAAVVGSMLGSVGGGIQVARLSLLLGYARRELRRLLNPHAIVLVRQDGLRVPEQTLMNAGSHQIAQFALIGFGAIALGFTGLSLTGSLWGALSSVSNLGPAVGDIGPFGDVRDLARPSRALMVLLMLFGRVAVLPLLTFLSFVLQWPRQLLRQLRLVGWQLLRRSKYRTANGDGVEHW